jgi:hypothetical protein
MDGLLNSGALLLHISSGAHALGAFVLHSA